MALQWLVLPLCYLIGSVSPSLLVVRLTRKLDLRTVGSGHLGATAAFTAGGMWPGIIAMVGDIAKGALAAYIARWAFGHNPLALLGLPAVVLGHNFPVFYGFRGGKGFAASCGALLVLAPQLLLPLVALGIIIALITENMGKPDQGHLIGMAMTTALPATTALLLPCTANVIVMLLPTAVILAAYQVNLPVAWRRCTMKPQRWHVGRVVWTSAACVVCFSLLAINNGPATAAAITVAAGLWVAAGLLGLTILACASRQVELIPALAGATTAVFALSVVVGVLCGRPAASLLTAMLSGAWPAETMPVAAWKILVMHHLLYGAGIAAAGLLRGLESKARASRSTAAA